MTKKIDSLCAFFLILILYAGVPLMHLGYRLRILSNRHTAMLWCMIAGIITWGALITVAIWLWNHLSIAVV